MPPTFFLSLLAILGIFSAKSFHLSLLIWWVLLGISLGLFVIRPLKEWPVLLTFFLISGFRYQLAHQTLEKNPLRYWEHRKLCLSVLSRKKVGVTGEGFRYLASVRGIVFNQHFIMKFANISEARLQKCERTKNIVQQHYIPIKTGILLFSPQELPEDRNLWVEGRIEALPKKLDFYRDIGFHQELSLSKILRVEKQTDFFPRLRAKIRETLNNSFEQDLSPKNRALALAIFWGNHYEISPPDVDDFRTTGTYHILVASGLKVGLVAGAAFLLAWTFPFYVRLGFSAAAVFFYAWLVGPEAPVQRAALMILLGFTGLWLGRGKDSFNGLILAFLLLLFWNPALLFDTGFQLSFLSVLGIFLFFEKIAAGFRFLPRWMAHSISLSLSAQLLLLIPLAYVFHNVSFISPLANLAVVPLCAASLLAGSVEILAGFSRRPLTNVISYGHDFILSSIFWLVHNLNKIPYASWWVASPSLFTIIFSYLLLFGAYLWISGKKPGKWISGISGFALLFLWIRSFLVPLPVSVTFLNVGQGNCAVFRIGRKAFLVNGGGSFRERPGFSVGERVLVPFLHSKGINRLEGIFLTGSRFDQVGGLPAVLQSFPVKQIWLPPISSSSFLYQKVLWEIRRKKIPLFFIRRGDTMKLPGNVWFVFYHPRACRFVFPPGKILKRLRTRGIRVFQTERNDTIQFEI